MNYTDKPLKKKKGEKTKKQGIAICVTYSKSTPKVEKGK